MQYEIDELMKDGSQRENLFPKSTIVRRADLIPAPANHGIISRPPLCMTWQKRQDGMVAAVVWATSGVL